MSSIVLKFNGDLYFSEISKIWKIESIEQWVSNYIIDSSLVTKIINNCLPINLIGPQVFKAVIFALIFYLIMSQL